MDIRITDSLAIIEYEIYHPASGCFCQEQLAERLSSRLHIERSEFNALFRAETGVAFKRHVQLGVLEAAAAQLKHSEIPLAQLTQQLGFSSQQAFTRAFTRHWGLSPLRFRLHGTTAPAKPLWLETSAPSPQHSDEHWPELTLWARRYPVNPQEKANVWRDFVECCAMQGLAVEHCYGIRYGSGDDERYLCAIPAPTRELPPPGWLVIAEPGGRMVVYPDRGNCTAIARLQNWLSQQLLMNDIRHSGRVIERFEQPPFQWDHHPCSVTLAFPHAEAREPHTVP